MTDTCPKQSPVRLYVAAAAVACSSACGLPPTTIELEKAGVLSVAPASVASQVDGLRLLVGGNCVVIDPGTTKTCVQIAAPIVANRQSCTVRSRTTKGVVSASTAGSCDIEATGAAGASPQTYTLACDAVTSGPCLANGTVTLVTLASAVDFITLSTNSGNFDNYVLTDATTPTLTLTLHNGATYCDSQFAAGSG